PDPVRQRLLAGGRGLGGDLRRTRAGGTGPVRAEPAGVRSVRGGVDVAVLRAAVEVSGGAPSGHAEGRRAAPTRPDGEAPVAARSPGRRAVNGGSYTRRPCPEP